MTDYKVKPVDLAQLLCLPFTDFFTRSSDSIGVRPLLTKITVSPVIRWVYFFNASGRKRSNRMTPSHPHTEEWISHPCLLPMKRINFPSTHPEIRRHHFPSWKLIHVHFQSHFPCTTLTHHYHLTFLIWIQIHLTRYHPPHQHPLQRNPLIPQLSKKSRRRLPSSNVVLRATSFVNPTSEIGYGLWNYLPVHWTDR